VRRLRDMRIPAAKTAVGMALVLALAGAASYAAVSHSGQRGHERDSPAAPPVSPTAPIAAPGSAALRIPTHPPAISTRPTARFRVEGAGEPTLRCRLDRRPAKGCEAAVVYRGVGVGPHSFYVQAIKRGRSVAHSSFVWTVLEPKPFTVSPQLSAIGPLYPGAGPTPIAVVIVNPNPIAITVTSLRVSAGGGPAGCDPGANLTLTAPALGTGRLRIPARGSVSLPNASVAAPTIALKELPVNQDACQGASFDLAFSGSAGA
jgi:hypothetical protein